MPLNNYKDLPYISLDELLHSDNADGETKFKVRAIVTNISPEPFVLLSYEWLEEDVLNTETRKYFSKIHSLPLYHVTLRDEHGTEYKTKYFYNEEKVIELRKSMRSPVYKDFIVTLFIGHMLKNYRTLQIGRGEFFLLVWDVIDADTPLQNLQASRTEIVDIEQKIKRIQNTTCLLDYIKNKLIIHLNIKGLSAFPELDKAIDLTIVQAFSMGMINNNSGKIHSALIGPPGTGKKLISLAISCLQPTCHQADPMKISMPGIVGSVRRRGSRWTSEPGLVPLANNGAFIIQDFHAVPNTVKRQLFGVFSMVMEDGEIADSTVAKQRHKAVTTIHIDLNKLSDIYLEETKPYTPSAKLKDIQLPLNILTRFDAIFEFERDAQRQLDIALSLHDQPPKVSLVKHHEKDEPWSRELKVMVAFIIENYLQPDVSKGVLDYIKEKQNQLFEENKKLIDRLCIVGDYQTRLSNSVHKYIYAIARMNVRDRVLRQDVDQAFGFVEYKFKFLKQILNDLKIPTNWDEPTYNMLDSHSRRQFIKDNFRDREFTVDDVVSLIKENYGDTVLKRTIYRDLETIAKVVKRIEKTNIYNLK